MVGVDVLPELVHSTQADDGATAEPERGHRPKLLMETDEELVQAASVYDVLQVAIPVGGGGGGSLHQHMISLTYFQMHAVNPFNKLTSHLWG